MLTYSSFICSASRSAASSSLSVRGDRYGEPEPDTRGMRASAVSRSRRRTSGTRAEPFQDAGGDAPFLIEERGEKVFGLERLVSVLAEEAASLVKALGRFHGQSVGTHRRVPLQSPITIPWIASPSSSASTTSWPEITRAKTV